MSFSLFDTACPEKQLLICCARTRMPPALAEKIRILVAGSLDWDYLLSEASENSLVPLLHRQLTAIAPAQIPSQQSDRLNDLARASTARSLMLIAELIGIMNAFAARGIAAIPYKGPVLATQAYGDATLREFEDLDIFVRHRDLAVSDEVLCGLGYRSRFPWLLTAEAPAAFIPVEYSYHDDARQLLIELHTERTLRHFPVPLDLDDLSRRLVPVLLSGHEVRTFCAEDLLPLLCIHGAKDLWTRLSWIADISELIQLHPQLDWHAVLHRADSLGAGRMLNVGLALAARLLAAPLPSEISLRVQNDRVANEVAAEVEQRLLSREFPALSAATYFHFRRRMISGTLAGLRYAIRLAIVPSEDDWEMVRLPAALAPLYVVLRPLRLLRKHGFSRRAPRAQ